MLFAIGRERLFRGHSPSCPVAVPWSSYVAQANDESGVTNKAVDDRMIIGDEAVVDTPSAGAPRGAPDHRVRGAGLVGPHTYEITLAGEAGSTLRAEFDDCEVIAGQGITTLRVELPDQGAFGGMLQRIIGLGLQVTHLRLLAPPSASSDECAQTVSSPGSGLMPAQTQI